MRPLLSLVLLIALGYLIAHLLFPKRRIAPDGRREAPREVTEELVRDPVCHLYLPRNEAIRRKIRRQEYFFCTSECLEKFLANRS